MGQLSLAWLSRSVRDLSLTGQTGARLAPAVRRRFHSCNYGGLLPGVCIGTWRSPMHDRLTSHSNGDWCVKRVETYHRGRAAGNTRERHRNHSTGKKTPGGAGTHTGHTGAHRHTDHTDEPHNHPNPPIHPHERTTSQYRYRLARAGGPGCRTGASVCEPCVPRLPPVFSNQWFKDRGKR